jgi:hypothetical protein
MRQRIGHAACQSLTEKREMAVRIAVRARTGQLLRHIVRVGRRVVTTAAKKVYAKARNVAEADLELELINPDKAFQAAVKQKRSKFDMCARVAARARASSKIAVQKLLG